MITLLWCFVLKLQFFLEKLGFYAGPNLRYVVQWHQKLTKDIPNALREKPYWPKKNSKNSKDKKSDSVFTKNCDFGHASLIISPKNEVPNSVGRRFELVLKVGIYCWLSKKSPSKKSLPLVKLLCRFSGPVHLHSPSRWWRTHWSLWWRCSDCEPSDLRKHKEPKIRTKSTLNAH